MTTLFLLVTGACQSLNELGVVSVTKKWSGPLATALRVCQYNIEYWGSDLPQIGVTNFFPKVNSASPGGISGDSV